MGGAGDPEPATVTDRNGPAGGATPWSRGPERVQRHEGNGRGDAVRLPAGSNPSKGANRAARSAGDAQFREELGAADAKRGEPHDRERDATSPHPPRGGSRRGGAKPRGRNEMPAPGSVGPTRAQAWGSGRAAGQAVEGREAHEPHERQGPTRPGSSDPGRGLRPARGAPKGTPRAGRSMRRVRPAQTTAAREPRGSGRQRPRPRRESGEGQPTASHAAAENHRRRTVYRPARSRRPRSQANPTGAGAAIERSPRAPLRSNPLKRTSPQA
jgi:hypothetical protein